MKSLLSCLLMMTGLGLLKCPCQAQEPKKRSPFGRYYVAAYLHRADYEIFYPSFPNMGGTRPWLVAVGRQLTPRFTVQLGYAYDHTSYYQNPEYTGTTATGQQIYGWRSYEAWTHTVPVSVRYTITPRPNARLKVDLVAGSTWLSVRSIRGTEEFVDGQSKGIFRDQDHARQWYVTAGLGARYAFGRRLEGVLDYGLIHNLRWQPEYIHLITVGNKRGLTRSLSLGLRYRFNLKKQAE